MTFRLLITALLLVLGGARHLCAAPLTQHVFVAHRGGNVQEDENTLESFTHAANTGMDYFECDPRLTKDGVFILMHDARVDRTTTGAGLVRDLTFAEIQTLRTKPRGRTIPTLEAALRLAKEKGIKIYLDIKLEDEASLEKLIGLVRKAGMERNVIIGVWWIKMQRWLHKNHPDLESAIPWPAPVPSLAMVKQLGAEWVGTLERFVTPKNVETAHKLGLRLITMEINDLNRMRELKNTGLDALQTDDPNIAVQLKKEMGQK